MGSQWDGMLRLVVHFDLPCVAQGGMQGQYLTLPFAVAFQLDLVLEISKVN